MASANIVINQGALPAGVASQSRDDLAVGILVQLSNAVDSGVRSWRWAMLGRPPGSAAVLSSPIDSNPTFTPDVVGTYRIQLSINEGARGQVDVRTAIIRDSNGLRVPAVGEADESNYLIGGTPNANGYTPDLQALLELSRGSSGGGGGGGWTEAYIGDFRDVGADIDLTVLDMASSPTVVINGVTWTSNEGAGGNSEQGSGNSFSCTTAAGLVYSGASVANFSSTNWAAHHVYTTWAELLGFEPYPNLQVCIQVYVSAATFSANNSDIGVGCYWDTPPSDVVINGSFSAGKGLRAMVAQFPAGETGVLMREGLSAYRGLHGTRLPSGANVAALNLVGGRNVDGGAGVHDGTAFPDVEDMAFVGSWGPNTAGFYASEYLDASERVALFFRNPGSAMSGTIQQVRVLVR